MIECLLWDFGNTLCDELSLWRGSPDWMAVYHSFLSHDRGRPRSRHVSSIRSWYRGRSGRMTRGSCARLRSSG